MAGFKDITGIKFDRLTAEECVQKAHMVDGKLKPTIWRCKCECGKVAEVAAGNLKSGKVRSCGCLIREVHIARLSTHGMSRTPQYWAWNAILSRCLNKNNKRFKDYGGRGITVAEEWLTFDGFWKDMSDGYSRGLMIERIDNNKGYFKNNCKWDSLENQNNNKRTNIRIELGGESLTIAQWARKLGLNRSNLYLKFKKGLPASEVLR